MSVSAMNARLVLVAALLSTCSVSRETSDGRGVQIQASAGEAFVLLCEIPKRDSPTVEWSKDGLGRKNITLLYRNGYEILEEKNKDFHNRTSLFMSEVKNGNISLRISNVRPSDAGKHECSIIHGNKRMVIKTLELIVSEDKKSCKVWSFVGAVAVADAVAVAVDVVAVVAVVAFVLGIGVGFPLVFFRNKICSYCAGRKIPPESHQRSVQSPDYQDASSYLIENQTDSGPTVTSEHLSKMEELELQLQEKERIISELMKNLNTLDRCRALSTFDVSSSQPSPDILNVINPHQFPNGNDPKPGASSNSNYSNSGSLSQEKDTKPGVSPSLSPYHGPVLSENSENEPVRHSKSLFDRPNLNFAKLQSRKSFSAGTRNHFSDKEDLSEEHLLPVDHLECDDPLSST